MPKRTNPLLVRGRLRFALTTVLLSWLAAFGPLCTDMYLPTLPDMAAELGLAETFVQSTLAACFLGLAAGQLLVGPLSDGTGRRPALVGSLLLFTVASLLCAISSSGTTLLLFRFLQGVGGAGGLVLSRALCCDVFRGRRLTSYLALLMAIHSLAPILGPVAGGFVGASFGWRGVFHVLWMVGVGLTAAAAADLPETLPPESRVRGGVASSFRNMGRLFGERAFLCFVGVQGFTSAGFFAYLSASPFIVQNRYGLSMEAFSLIFGAISVGLLLASLLASFLARRLGDRTLMLLGDGARAAVCLGVLAAAIIDFDSPFPILSALFLMVFMGGITMPTSFSLAVRSQGVGAGAASGLLGVSGFLFGSLAAPLAGVMGPESAVPLGIIAAAGGAASLSCTVLGLRLAAARR